PAARTGGAREITEYDVNAAVKKVADERTKVGAFVFRDPKLNADLHLIFEQIKNVRGMQGYGWFPNVIFHDKDEPKKQYAIDFWFKPDGQDLKLMDIRVQKGPKQEGDGWVMITRAPQAWWWLPAGEHPGDMEVTRAWQVMSAIHGYIATHKDKDGNLDIKDDKTGETLPLEFVEIHQPVRHLKKEGEYFACTDFRKPGSQDEYYDIDFWVNQKTGKLEVDNVKVHKVPVQEDGVWTQVPRYTFDGMDIKETTGRENEGERAEALDQALNVFWAKGYEGTSIADLTAAMGINPPSLYAAFGNKETLFRKALDRYEARRGEIFDEAFTAP